MPMCRIDGAGVVLLQDVVQRLQVAKGHRHPRIVGAPGGDAESAAQERDRQRSHQ